MYRLEPSFTVLPSSPVPPSRQQSSGNFTYLESGVKDCSECLVPHRRENYGFIADSF
ncbi:hypothetical protein NE659_25760, partial [Flavonifractor plautii]|uniref:cysteine-rich small domain-containing protein n=1 Tax=Flavonifractor plautii TaxID=292800 RepID=UPI0027312FDE